MEGEEGFFIFKLNEPHLTSDRADFKQQVYCNWIRYPSIPSFEMTVSILGNTLPSFTEVDQLQTT